MPLAHPENQKAGDQHAITLLRAIFMRSSADVASCRTPAISRADLSRLTRLRPNTVGSVIDEMIASGWLMEEAIATPQTGRGRPPVRVRIDPARRNLVGLALSPHRLQVVRINLLGQPLEQMQELSVEDPAQIEAEATSFLSSSINDDTLAIGISSPGLVDEAGVRLLFSSTAPDTPGMSLSNVFKAAGDLPLVFDNDMHALGDRWRLSTPTNEQETVVLISLADGAVGASIMMGGRPADAGCVHGGNELGHMQIHTGSQRVPRCYCGQTRCVERIFSSDMVRSMENSRRQLATCLQEIDDSSSTGAWIIERLGEAVANMTNLLRPHRLVIVGEGAVNRVMPAVMPTLDQAIKNKLLPILKDRVEIEAWHPHSTGQTSCLAVTAGYLGISMLLGQRPPASGAVILRAP